MNRLGQSVIMPSIKYNYLNCGIQTIISISAKYYTINTKYININKLLTIPRP
jgi:hypothetical protein